MNSSEFSKMLKEKFHEAERKALKRGDLNYRTPNLYTVEMVLALLDMAANDVYPDEKFGDVDCELWCSMRMMRKIPH